VANFINLQCSICPICKTILKSEHFISHGVQVPNVPDLLDELRVNIGGEKNRGGNKIQRDVILKELGDKVSIYNERMKKFLNDCWLLSYNPVTSCLFRFVNKSISRDLIVYRKNWRHHFFRLATSNWKWTKFSFFLNHNSS